MRRLLATRGAQLLARYLCKFAVAFATACGFSNQWAVFGGALVSAAVLDLADHWSHGIQKETER